MKVGMHTQRKLQGFLYWYHAQRKRGMIPAAADFNATTMRLVVNEFEAEISGKELDLMELDPGKIDMDLKLCMFKEALLNMAKNVMGVDNDPLYYVIRPNAFEKRMYQLSHTKAVYNRDNEVVRGKILKASLNNPI